MVTQPLVLVVDDNPLNVDVLEEVLDDADCRVITAFSGAEAIAAAKAERPNLVLLDVIMPEMDGIATCGQFKADPDLSPIPIILMTALDDLDITKVLRNSGAVGYITKPFQEEDVLTCLKQHL
ncbi:MAG: response regulator [Cyanobacteria bacterium P01_G01_bin.54]